MPREKQVQKDLRQAEVCTALWKQGGSDWGEGYVG